MSPSAAATKKTSTARPARIAAGNTEREPVTIELTPAQVGQIIRGASDSGRMASLISGLDEVRGLLKDLIPQLSDSRLSRSLLSGLLLLASLPDDGSYIGVTALARLNGMNGSTTHRYLATLLAVGLAERDPATRQYRVAQ